MMEYVQTNILRICEFIGISTSEFWECVSPVNTKLFDLKDNKITKKFKVGEGFV